VSRVGKRPLRVPEGVEVTLKNQKVTVKGPKGTLERPIHPGFSLETKDGELHLVRPGEAKSTRALHGLYRSLIHNMVIGVSKGFERKLEIVGVGYRAESRGRGINFLLGFSHPIFFVPPEGVSVRIDSPTNLTVAGIDKELVGQVAAKIRSFRLPEPYKGKGIRYEGEQVRRKAGKAAA
jgi:large subunit ribosomal protein L6